MRLGRLTSTKSQAMPAATYAYSWGDPTVESNTDAWGDNVPLATQVTTETRPDRAKVTMADDVDGRPVKVGYWDSTLTKTFAYDLMGRAVVSATSAAAGLAVDESNLYNELYDRLAGCS